MHVAMHGGGGGGWGKISRVEILLSGCWMDLCSVVSNQTPPRFINWSAGGILDLTVFVLDTGPRE